MTHLQTPSVAQKLARVVINSMFGKSKREILELKARLESLEEDLDNAKKQISELQQNLSKRTSIRELKEKNLDGKFKEGIGGYFASLVNLEKEDIASTFDASDKSAAEAVRMMDPIRRGFSELRQGIPAGYEVELGGGGPGHAESFAYRSIRGYIFAEPERGGYKCSCTHSGPPESWTTEKFLEAPETVLQFVAKELAREIGLEEVLQSMPKEGWRRYLKDGEGRQ